jgi:hypothetical protein
MPRDEILLDRSQCPICHGDLQVKGLMDESVWDSMTVSSRVALCKVACLEGKVGAKDYDRLTEEEAEILCDMECDGCGTVWPIADLLDATCTPNQVEIYLRDHKGEDTEI